MNLKETDIRYSGRDGGSCQTAIISNTVSEDILEKELSHIFLSFLKSSFFKMLNINTNINIYLYLQNFVPDSHI